MALTDQPVISAIIDWFKEHYLELIVSILIILVGIILYLILVRQLKRLRTAKKLNEQYAKLLTRGAKWVLIFTIVISILVVFDITIGAVTGIVALFGGTILGFAAINTIGNAIAGIIVMSSRPFHVGDRILFKDTLADVISVELMYTKLQTLDNVIISIPNQELLHVEITNFGKDNVIRRSVVITPGYGYEHAYVEKTLLEAAASIEGILIEPASYVWITAFENFAVQYTLYYFIAEVHRMKRIEAALRSKIFELTREYKIDISTPSLFQRVGE